MSDEGSSLSFKVTRQKVIFQQNVVLQCLMPRLNLALSLRTIRHAAKVLHAPVFQPFGQVTEDIAKPIVAEQPILPDLHEVFKPFIIETLRNPLRATQLSNTVFATKAIQYDPDLLFRKIILARSAFDIFDDVLARALRCFSHLPLLSDYDEKETLS